MSALGVVCVLLLAKLYNDAFISTGSTYLSVRIGEETKVRVARRDVGGARPLIGRTN